MFNNFIMWKGSGSRLRCALMHFFCFAFSSFGYLIKCLWFILASGMYKRPDRPCARDGACVCFEKRRCKNSPLIFARLATKWDWIPWIDASRRQKAFQRESHMVWWEIELKNWAKGRLKTFDSTRDQNNAAGKRASTFFFSQNSQTNKKL